MPHKILYGVCSEEEVLVAQSNLAVTYKALGRLEESLHVKRDVYSGFLKIKGEQHRETHGAAINYANSLFDLKRHAEAKSLLRKTMPVARRVLGESHEFVLRMRWCYAVALYEGAATRDDLRDAVTTLEERERTARRVFGGAHPVTTGVEISLRKARAALRARETPSTR
jgi:hypothetical protein